MWASPEFGADGAALEQYLPARSRRPVTIAATARRIADGIELREAVADFLDDFRFARDSDDAQSRIDDEPELVDAHTDAFLAAIAEHVAAASGLRTPPWARRPERFLDHFWWPSSTSALHARALVESPAAFRRRGVFIGRTSLQRV